jgi:hypothetical protein
MPMEKNSLGGNIGVVYKRQGIGGKQETDSKDKKREFVANPKKSIEKPLSLERKQ